VKEDEVQDGRSKSEDADPVSGAADFEDSKTYERLFWFPVCPYNSHGRSEWIAHSDAHFKGK
jgi:hypothetical protein